MSNFFRTDEKKIAIVTGASRGIGAAIADKLGALNYFVIGTSTSGYGKSEGVSKWIKVDFSNSKETENFIAQIKKLESIEILINNAGINIIKEQKDVLKVDFDQIQKINLRGPYFLSSLIASKMATTGGGKIVNLSSIWSVNSKINRTLYSTMKSGVNGLTRSMAVEWASSNILVNSISPGFVETELTKKSLTAQQQDEIKKQIPLKRFAQPEEIAEMVSFLSSDKNTYLTGQNIIIDGGFTIV